MAGGAQAAESLRIGVDVPYEPMEYKTPDGELTGFDIELGNAICAKINRDCEWVIQAWDGIIPGLMARKYDAIMSSMTINEERREKVLFSDTYITPPSAWFAPSDSELSATSQEALADKAIGVQRGTLQDNYVTDLYGKNAEVKRYTTADDLVLDMEAGRLDIAFLDFPVGKSTLINTLAGRPAAKTGNEPAVTRAQQAIKLPNNILLYDTPGFLWPKLSPEACGYRLAVTGAIRSAVLDFEDVAMFEAEYLLEAYPDLVRTRYGFAELPKDALALMDGIAEKRRFFGRGGIPDLHKVSEVLLNEFRAGTLGRISLETPEMVEREAREAEAAAAEKAAREEASGSKKGARKGRSGKR